MRVRELVTLPWALPKAYKGPKRETLSGLVFSLGLILVVSNLTGLLPDSWGHHINAYMPTNAGQLIMQPHQAPDDLLSPWQGLAVFTGWTRLKYLASVTRTS